MRVRHISKAMTRGFLNDRHKIGRRTLLRAWLIALREHSRRRAYLDDLRGFWEPCRIDAGDPSPLDDDRGRKNDAALPEFDLRAARTTFVSAPAAPQRTRKQSPPLDGSQHLFSFRPKT